MNNIKCYTKMDSTRDSSTDFYDLPINRVYNTPELRDPKNKNYKRPGPRRSIKPNNIRITKYSFVQHAKH